MIRLDIIQPHPVAFLTPCHRAIQQSGLGGYRWGLTRKRAIVAWEERQEEELQDD